MILKPHELLYCYRKRSDRTQKQVAEEFGLPIKVYQAIENGKSELLESIEDLPEAIAKTLVSFFQKNSGVTKLDKCIALRRRRNFYQRQIGEQIGCSRAWVNEMETGKVDPAKLIAYWEKSLLREL